MHLFIGGCETGTGIMYISILSLALPLSFQSSLQWHPVPVLQYLAYFIRELLHPGRRNENR